MRSSLVSFAVIERQDLPAAVAGSRFQEVLVD